MSRVLICGDRNWFDESIIEKIVRKYCKNGDIIIHGACKGADRIGGHVAEGLGFDIDVYPAEWNKYGRSAGPIRNKQMLDSGLDLVLAFHDDISASKGTKDMINRARKANIKVVLTREI